MRNEKGLTSRIPDDKGEAMSQVQGKTVRAAADQSVLT